MNNPFQNFNNQYSPRESDFMLLLDRLEVQESRDILTVAGPGVSSYPWMEYIRRSPLAWAGGLSIASAMAVMLLLVSGSTKVNTTVSVAIDNKVKTNIDQALATVSNIEGVADNNKF